MALEKVGVVVEVLFGLFTSHPSPKSPKLAHSDNKSLSTCLSIYLSIYLSTFHICSYYGKGFEIVAAYMESKRNRIGGGGGGGSLSLFLQP